MIEIEIGKALLIYLSLFLCFIFSLWVFWHLKQKKQKPLTPLYELAICEFCKNAYLADPLKSVSKCPTCHLLNKGNLYKKIKK